MEKLAQERKRSEELLCRMMPKAIADRLKLGGKAVETCEVDLLNLEKNVKLDGLKHHLSVIKWAYGFYFY